MESVSKKVYLNGDAVGDVTVEKSGLYYLISCVCRLPKDRIFRIYARTEETDINLGVCVPKEDRFVLQAKIPIQRIGAVSPQFYAAEKKENPRSFYKIGTGEPFDHIELLRECRLVVRDNQPFLTPNEGYSSASRK